MSWIVLILISALLSSFRTILMKELLVKNNTLPILFFVSFFSSIMMLMFKSEININLSLSIYLLLFLKSFVIAISWYCIYQAYKNLEISTVSPLRNLSPVFLVLLSFIFLHESISLINYVGVFVLIISAYLLELKSFSRFLEPLKLFKSKFFIFIVISLITTSISAILDKILIVYINYYSIMFIFYFFLTIIYLIVLILLKKSSSLLELLNKKYLFSVLLITLFAFLSDWSYFMAVALPGTFIVLLIPLRRTSTFMSTMIGGKLFNEKNIFYKGIVSLIMIFGILLLVH